MSVKRKKQQERHRSAYHEAIAQVFANKPAFKVGERLQVKGITCVVVGVSPTLLKLKFVEKGDE